MPVECEARPRKPLKQRFGRRRNPSLQAGCQTKVPALAWSLDSLIKLGGARTDLASWRIGDKLIR